MAQINYSAEKQMNMNKRELADAQRIIRDAASKTQDQALKRRWSAASNELGATAKKIDTAYAAAVKLDVNFGDRSKEVLTLAEIGAEVEKQKGHTFDQEQLNVKDISLSNTLEDKARDLLNDPNASGKISKGLLGFAVAELALSALGFGGAAGAATSIITTALPLIGNGITALFACSPVGAIALAAGVAIKAAPFVKRMYAKLTQQPAQDLAAKLEGIGKPAKENELFIKLESPEGPSTPSNVEPEPTPKPGPTNTDKPGPTNTDKPGPTNTDKPGPTNTDKPGPTNTDKPGPTNTDKPGPTNTDKPGPTNTDKPGPTNTDKPDAEKPAITDEQIKEALYEAMEQFRMQFPGVSFDGKIKQNGKEIGSSRDLIVSKAAAKLETLPAIVDKHFDAALKEFTAAMAAKAGTAVVPVEPKPPVKSDEGKAPVAANNEAPDFNGTAPILDDGADYSVDPTLTVEQLKTYIAAWSKKVERETKDLAANPADQRLQQNLLKHRKQLASAKELLAKKEAEANKSNEGQAPKKTDAAPALPAGEAPKKTDAVPALPAGEAPKKTDAVPALPAGEAPKKTDAVPALPAGEAPKKTDAVPALPAGETPDKAAESKAKLGEAYKKFTEMETVTIKNLKKSGQPGNGQGGVGFGFVKANPQTGEPRKFTYIDSLGLEEADKATMYELLDAVVEARQNVTTKTDAKNMLKNAAKDSRLGKANEAIQQQIQ